MISGGIGKRVHLITGGPGVGKTTLIKETMRTWRGALGGFYTEEIRVHGRREGFRIVTLDGREGVLAHVNYSGPPWVGKYGVDVYALEEIAVTAIKEAIRQGALVIIDEIGKMELCSSHFREAVSAALREGMNVLGTIMLTPHPWANEIKGHPAVRLITLERTNRDSVIGEINQWLESLQSRATSTV